MARTRFTQTLAADVDREMSFFKMVASSDVRRWEGIFASRAQLGIIDFDLAPTAEWSVENFVLQISEKPITLTHFGSKRTRTGISVPGTLVFQPRNEPVKVMWSGTADNLAFGVTDSLLKQVAAETRPGDPEHVRLLGFGIFDDALMTQIGWTLLDLLQSEELDTRLYVEALGISLAHHLLYKYSADKAGPTHSVPAAMLNQQLRDALEYMHANYQKDLSLSEIAASAHLSVAHFSRLFRKATGYSPYQYLIRCRVEHAYRLFSFRKYTTAQISQMVGFYDQSHLLRHFKRAYGISPSKVRT
jgi:AraC family transcriptional regulator